MTKTFPARKHHCTSLACLRPLLESRGYRYSEGSWETDNNAFAFSVETIGYGVCRSAACTIELNKLTGKLTVTDANARGKGWD